MWIRNNWGLWKGSRLSRYFNEIGIAHPDDMSGIILTSYYRHKKGEDIRLEDQIKDYQSYWKVIAKPTKDSYPDGVQDIEFKEMMFYKKGEEQRGAIHVGTSTVSGETWLYDCYLGWKKVTEKEVKWLEQSAYEREDVLNKIYERTQ